MSRTTVPKTTVHEDGDAHFPENEIRVAENPAATAPAFNAVLSKN
jgi:hypothetical protein